LAFIHFKLTILTLLIILIISFHSEFSLFLLVFIKLLTFLCIKSFQLCSQITRHYGTLVSTIFSQYYFQCQ